MAHIKKLDANRWQARYRGPDGRERARNFGRRSDAERWLTSVESSKLRGEWTDPDAGRIDLKRWLGEWFASVSPSLKPKTVATYESLLRSRIVPELGSYRLTALGPAEVDAWVAGMRKDGLSASRIRQAHVVLSKALRAAVRDGRVARNVALGASLPRLERQEAPYFEPHVVESIAAEMPEPYGLLIRILGTLGPRFGEAAALRRRSVDLLRRRLRIEESVTEISGRQTFGATKSHSERSIPLTPSLVVALERHLDSSVGSDPAALVFTSPEGSVLRHSAFSSRVWHPALRRLELPAVGLHVLRHSAAAGMISAGGSPKAVQTILGHRSAAFTMTVYGHLFDADLDELAAKLDAPADSLRTLPRSATGIER